ncbi:NAD-dependent epimerase/dehydratase family protein [Pseudomonas sp. ADAK2]|uniref:NAD-dependent epimerase/dehydratase family protein n=1 Tax=unclassified Pseudomonas TaxID=196821 RepID=UPI0014636CD5|nr:MULTISPECIES: NAD-dependent epimerase/dehydratase family protein [unclassified Pseudomonas]QJI44960.1 NAD-dependent epimerase/dehydratase family protein [Pseudomonas sp. ADAK7]QJI51261.1 NAD-dependent epimerase/dehydratase family protein [Pseudomonas sp. ADAK2]
MKDKKIVLPGGAGLVGQNLVARLIEKGYTNIIVLDKHVANIKILKGVQPSITVEYADLAIEGEWAKHFIGADTVVMLQAQIGGTNYDEFVRNNVNSTSAILKLIKELNIPQLVHISSSVVESKSNDFYTVSKKAQEKLVIDSGIPCPILRPTLMFGWFDRKHLGWLSRFMKKVPVFPIPGNGRYMRQPLYVGDFCNVIISCIENTNHNNIFNISGHEKIDYIDIIKQIKKTNKLSTVILNIPYSLFYVLLWTWSLFDRNPPFTTQQLAALSAKDEFEVIDWPTIFNVKSTSFKDAIDETYNHPIYGKIVLEF